MKRSGFSKPTPAKLKEAQERKRLKMLSKPRKVKKVVSTVKLRKTPLRGKSALSSTKKRKVKSPLKKLKAELWELCKQIIRKKYQNEDGTWHCFTCDQLIDIPAKAQTGHGIPSSVGGILLRYHLDNLRIQNHFCNINLGGNGGEYYKRLVLEIGQEKVDALYALKQQSGKADEAFFIEKIQEYKAILATL